MTTDSRGTIARGALLALGGFAAALGAATDARAGQYARISDDLQLYYEDAGQGPPMVWVPGWTGLSLVGSSATSSPSGTRT